MKQILLQKASIGDGLTVLAGGFVVALNEHLPLTIGVLTAILLVARIILSIQEYRIKKKLIEPIEDDK